MMTVAQATATETSNSSPTATAPVALPRITIKFCTQCKWNLRAAYFAQELLQTFSTSLGEVALVPSTGGIFIVEIVHADVTSPPSALDSVEENDGAETSTPWQTRVLWDRRAEGGFPERSDGEDEGAYLRVYILINFVPETKELKKRLRDIIDPSRDLGHVDRTHSTTRSITHNILTPVHTHKKNASTSSQTGLSRSQSLTHSRGPSQPQILPPSAPSSLTSATTSAPFLPPNTFVVAPPSAVSASGYVGEMGMGMGQTRGESMSRSNSTSKPQQRPRRGTASSIKLEEEEVKEIDEVEAAEAAAEVRAALGGLGG
ncbi:MAG: hypothetical protein M1827_000916 [Pycnora praestabilis]|nr:MAG: hypothetical protein M1827_000916 [Pycnora praestabilis]